jgi:hypothetical protein
MTLILWKPVYDRIFVVLCRDALLLEILTAHHSPGKVFGRALMARLVKVAVLVLKTGLERLDSRRMRLFASTSEDARDGESSKI